MRRYDDPVEVRRGMVTGVEGPEQFLWRGRLWKVRAVLAHWVETGPWWQSVVEGATAERVVGDGRVGGGRVESLDLAERECWRVEAGRGPLADGGGVFDLALDGSDGRWQLVGCAD